VPKKNAAVVVAAAAILSNAAFVALAVSKEVFRSKTQQKQ
jgi:hypothetical protein